MWQSTKVFFSRLMGWLTVWSLGISGLAALYLYVYARGSDAALMDWRVFGVVTKWHLLDLHTVLGMFGLLTALGWFAVRKVQAPEKPPASLWRRVPWAAILAAVIVITGGQEVLDDHPVLVERVRLTDHPATAAPDQVTLTWGGDPSQTQSVQWRTYGHAQAGALRYRQAPADPWRHVEAESFTLDDPYLVNDPFVRRHTVRLEGLEPGTAYEYQVAHGELWSETYRFETAPKDADTFEFVYLGDAQNGLREWAKIMQAAASRHPEADFFAIAGDLVDGGEYRDEWDLFFAGSAGVLESRQLVPVVGNHETSLWHGPRMYLEMFDLPRNGPDALRPEQAYCLDYANARFIVLDSNVPPASQRDWLEQCLSEHSQTWTIVLYHHPAYSSKPGRDNPEIREHWTPLFDRYGVALALQGHDHAYLRTKPLKGGEPATAPGEGTTYVVSVSGTKYYEQADRPHTAKAFAELSTYQVIEVDGNRLRYTSYDLAGEAVDAFEIVQNGSTAAR